MARNCSLPVIALQACLITHWFCSSASAQTEDLACVTKEIVLLKTDALASASDRGAVKRGEVLVMIDEACANKHCKVLTQKGQIAWIFEDDLERSFSICSDFIKAAIKNWKGGVIMSQNGDAKDYRSEDCIGGRPQNEVDRYAYCFVPL
jgi:hypothetical protein